MLRPRVVPGDSAATGGLESSARVPARSLRVTLTSCHVSGLTSSTLRITAGPEPVSNLYTTNLHQNCVLP